MRRTKGFMEIFNIKISELIPADYNPRKLTEKQGADIRQSLKSFGFVDPIIVNQHPDRANIIVGGHMRVKVWALMGEDTVPVVYVNLDEARERELNVRLNKNAGDWDWEILANQFDVDNLKAWGFENAEFGMASVDNYPESSSKEIDPDNYKMGHQCPKCGFEFDDKNA